MAKKILVVDDEPTLARWIEHVLSEKGYEVFKASSGQEALPLMFTHKPDMVLLDVVMPKMDGWQACSRIRELSDVPIIMLTGAQRSEDDIVRGLDYGADDYLLKPIGGKELLARVRAALRRADLTPGAKEQVDIVYADEFISVNLAERRVMVSGQRVKLTPREFRLFTVLVENAGRILTHRQLLEKVWGWEYTDDLDYVRIYISHLRQKIEPDPALPRYIITEPGVGYSFVKSS